MLVILYGYFILVKERFAIAEDHNLAQQLQDQEFKDHYDSNRMLRRTSSTDHRMSREEQERAMDEYLKGLNEAQKKDAELALELQRQFEEEEREIEEAARMARENQAKEDEELARRLHEEEERAHSSRRFEPVEQQPNEAVSIYIYNNS